MLVLGLRRGELLGLAWEDVDLAECEAQIGWQVQRLKGELVRRRTKTAKSPPPLPLPAICVEVLESRRVTEATWRLATWSGSGLVLTTRLGDPLDPRNFQRYFKAQAGKAGVPVISIHATRRTCASLLVALDVHPRVAMAVLRHSKIAVTMDIILRSLLPPRERPSGGSATAREGVGTTSIAVLLWVRRPGRRAQEATRASDLKWSQGDSNP